MKKILRTLILGGAATVGTTLFFATQVQAQVVIGSDQANAINANAVLRLVSPGNNQGFLAPVLTSTQRNGMSLGTGDRGMLVFDSNTNSFHYWNGSGWQEMGTGGGGGGSTYVLQLNGNNFELLEDGAVKNSVPLSATNPATNDILQWNGSNWTAVSLPPVDLTPAVDGGITITVGNEISVNVDNTTLEIVGNLIQVADGSIDNTKLAAGAVGTNNIQDGAVTDVKINDIDPAKINQGGAATNQVLKWDGTNWTPANDDTGAGTTPTLANGQILVGDGATNSAGTVGGDVSLSGNNFTVTGIQNNPVSTAAPAEGQILEFTSGQWVPVTPAAGGTQNLNQVLTEGNDAGTQNIANLADPVNNQDAATKNYVDTGDLGDVQTTDNPAAGDVSGSYTAGFTVGAIQNNAVSTTAPATNDVLKWDGTQWIPQPDDVGGGSLPAITNAQILTNDGSTNVARDVGGDALMDNTGSFTVVGLHGNPVSGAAPGIGQVLEWNGTEWAPALSAVTPNALNDVLTAGNDAGAQNITNMADPVNAQDAATKNYIDLNFVGVNANPAAGVITGSYTAGFALADNSVTDAKIVGVAPAKITAGTDGQVLTTNGGITVWQDPATVALPNTGNGEFLIGDGAAVNPVVISGDITIDNTGLATIAGNAVNTLKLADNAVSTLKVQDDAVTPAKIQGNGGTRSILGSNSAGDVLWVPAAGPNQLLGTDLASNLAFRDVNAAVVDGGTGVRGLGTATNANLVTEKAVREAINAVSFNTANAIPVGDGTGLSASDIFNNTGAGNIGFFTNTPAASFEIFSNDAMIIPRGGDAERPGTGLEGMFRFNTDQLIFEGYNGSIWVDLSGGGSSLWTDAAPNIYYNTGFVGIGTTLPEEFLDVEGDVAAGFVSMEVENINSNGIASVDIRSDALEYEWRVYGSTTGNANLFELFENANGITVMQYDLANNTTYYPGSLEFDGELLPFGDPGTAGQVLSSQGAGSPPIWITSLVNQLGTQNLFGGTNSGINLNTGEQNTVYGEGAGLEISDGQRNVAIGTNALNLNSTGNFNVAIGSEALSNSTDRSNTAVGTNAMQNTTVGIDNVSVGINSLRFNTTGTNNTAIGAASLENVIGSSNVAVGFTAGKDITTGDNNTFIGSGADAGLDGLTNSTAIGAGATVDADNSLILGNGANVGIGTSAPAFTLEVIGTAGKTGGGAWATSSDKRLKENIQEIDNGMNTIMKLRPVSYQWRDFYLKKYPAVKDHTYYNFIAQDFIDVFPNSVHTDKNGFYAIDIHNVTPFLVKAVQELNMQNETLRQQIEEKERLISQLEEKLDRESSETATLQQEIEKIKAYLGMDQTASVENE